MKLFENLDDKRKNDIKKSISENYKLSCQNNVNDFTIILKEMLFEKDVKVSKNFFINSKNLIEKLIELNMCKIFSVQNKEGVVLYYCVFIYNNNKGYYLFGAGKREIMSRYAGTFCLWESMKRLASLGVMEINLEGVNSPERGDFKLSFGGNLEKYFELCFRN
jgi:lipid II:glycine glycyltransferase (peptidoglycan interpeptide bridge formation enzyme)